LQPHFVPRILLKAALSVTYIIFLAMSQRAKKCPYEMWRWQRSARGRWTPSRPSRRSTGSTCTRTCGPLPCGLVREPHQREVRTVRDRGRSPGGQEPPGCPGPQRRVLVQIRTRTDRGRTVNLKAGGSPFPRIPGTPEREPLFPRSLSRPRNRGTTGHPPQLSPRFGEVPHAGGNQTCHDAQHEQGF
jgi:hypothetical protein